MYTASEHRYGTMQYNRVGISGLKLPAVSLGLWHNFGDNGRFDTMRSMCLTTADGRFLRESALTERRLSQIRQLNDLAARRGQTLAQMALSWILRDGIVTSVLAGASKPEQALDNIQAARNTSFTAEELALIDQISL